MIRSIVKNQKFYRVKGVKEKLFEQYNKYKYINARSYELTHDPNFNKSLAFSEYERRTLGLEGFLPQATFSLEQQAKVIMDEFESGIMAQVELNKDEETNVTGVTPDMIRKSRVLNNLQDLDNTLFYNLMIDNWKESLSIIHTPTVAWNCKNYSKLYQRPRGMVISLKDKGNISAIMKNCPFNECHAFFLTDGSKVMSIGDWGVGGQPICVARKDIYVASAGYNPWKTLPIVIDVGTNNEQLLNDPHYYGLKQKRASDEEYFELLDEFMYSSSYNFPEASYIFEDIQIGRGIKILERYSHKFKVFNECIKGSGSVILAGILSGLKIQDHSFENIRKLKIFIVGAGNAATGIIYFLSYFLKNFGMRDRDIQNNIFVFDVNGLVTKQNCENEALIEYLPDNSQYQGEALEAMTKKLHPHVLIGCSGQKGIFTKGILSNMCKDVNMRPMIFALSNPTSKAECTVEEAVRHTDGRAIFTSGSPFENYTDKNGNTTFSNTAYNAYVTPGLSRALTIGRIKKLYDELYLEATLAITDMQTENCKKIKKIYPHIQDLCDVSDRIAARVLIKAYEMNLIHQERVNEFLGEYRSIEEVVDFVKRRRWEAQYRNLIYTNTTDNQF